MGTKTKGMSLIKSCEISGLQSSLFRLAVSLYGVKVGWRVLLPVGISVEEITYWNSQHYGPTGSRAASHLHEHWPCSTHISGFRCSGPSTSVCVRVGFRMTKDYTSVNQRGKKEHVWVVGCSKECGSTDFSLWGKEVTNLERGEAKMNSAVLDGNWKYQYEHTVVEVVCVCECDGLFSERAHKQWHPSTN